MNLRLGGTRFVLADTFVIFLVLLGIYWMVLSIHTELHYKWRWSEVAPYLVYTNENGGWESGLILKGLAGTVRLTVVSALGALILALPIALLQMSRFRALRVLGKTYVEILRNVPPLVFMFIFYFFISTQLLTGWDVNSRAEDHWGDSAAFRVLFGETSLFENYLSGALCLIAFEAAYVAEIYRAGIQSIPRGQSEASFSLGLSRIQTFRLVIMPQALRKISPPLASQLITLIKDSSIISVISIQELTFTGVEAAVSSGRFFEVWLIVAVLYFFLSYPISHAFRRIEAGAPSNRE